MWQRITLAALVLVVPPVCSAQQKVERLLPAGSQLFLRWDGVAKHQAAYDKTAVGKMMKGETGTFLRALFKYAGDQAAKFGGPQFNNELVNAVKDEIYGVCDTCGKQGFVLGVELKGIDPPQAQAVMVFPGGAGDKKSPLSLVNLLTKLDPNTPVKELMGGGRKVKYISEQGVHFAWWAEGKDAVFAIGTETPADLLKRIDGKGKTIAALPVYKEINGFNEFPSWFDGYLDLPLIGKVAGGGKKEIADIVEALGLKAVKSFTFHGGFDGPAERTVMFLNLNKGPRKGILKLASKKTFTLKDLPPMPPGATGFSASNFDASALYDVGLQLSDKIIKIVDPQGTVNPKKAIRDFEKVNNVSIKEMLDSLDNMVVSYADGNEGFFGSGAVSLFKVKNADKLNKAMNGFINVAQNNFGGLVDVKTTKYHGADLKVVYINNPLQGSAQFGGTYTIYKGWLAVANAPQPLKGLILRLNGELPAWKADAELKKALAKFPKKMTGISVSDPRPTVRFVFSVLPLVSITINNALSSAFPGGPQIDSFDVTLIPNSYQAARHLFPNVTVTTDEGTRIRSETRASLMLPF